jgi:2TM domain
MFFRPAKTAMHVGSFRSDVIEELDRAPPQRGYPWPMDEAREEARRYVRRKRIFYTLFGAWIALSLMWFTIDMLDDGTESLWFYWPMFGTGIALAISAIAVLGIGGLFGADWEQREIDKYLRRRGNDPGG